MPSRFSSPGSVSDAEALVANLGIRALTRADRGRRTRRSSPCSPSRSASGPARPGRGEPAGPHPGHDPHDGLEQVRLAGAHDRQQERDSRRATRPCTATWPAGSRSSRTSRRRSCTPSPGTATTAPDRALIPDAVLEKPPSAELRPDQRDSDSLPDYADLDPIVEDYVEGDRSVRELVDAGPRPGHGATGRVADRPQRVQAPPGRARRAGVAQGVRQGPAPADHEPLARLSAGPAPVSRYAAEGRAGPRRAASSASRSRSSTTRSATSSRSRISCCASRIAVVVLGAVRRRRSAVAEARTTRPLCAPGSSPGVLLAARLRGADRRPDARVAVDVGVHHRPLRRADAARRVASCADACRRAPCSAASSSPRSGSTS